MTEVRIGIIQVPRELSVEVEDKADDVIKQVSKAMADSDGLLWLTDSKGRKVGVTLEKLAYVEVEPDSSPRAVGFSR